MEKIIVAFDGLKYEGSSEEYALYLAAKSDTFVVGVFLEDFTHHSYKLFDMVGSQGVSQEKVKHLIEGDKKKRHESVLRFQSACKKRGVRYDIHHDKSIALQELLRETIYADLLIINSNETLTHFTEGVPTRFIQDLLANVQCPAMVIPSKYKPIDRITLLYDGEPSSVFAVKMFCYMLPFFKDLEAEVLMVNPSEEQKGELPDGDLIKEFIRCHMPNATFNIHFGDPRTEIINYLKTRENSLVVLGAYRRSLVSRWFNESLADTILREVELPLFIAHNR